MARPDLPPVGITSPDLQYARAVALTVHEERARLAIALTRLYATTGNFSAVAAAATNCLRELAARVQADGGDIGGWVA